MASNSTASTPADSGGAEESVFVDMAIYAAACVVVFLCTLIFSCIADHFKNACNHSCSACKGCCDKMKDKCRIQRKCDRHPLPWILLVFAIIFALLGLLLPWGEASLVEPCVSCGGGERLVCTASISLTESCTNCDGRDAVSTRRLSDDLPAMHCSPLPINIRREFKRIQQYVGFGLVVAVSSCLFAQVMSPFMWPGRILLLLEQLATLVAFSMALSTYKSKSGAAQDLFPPELGKLAWQEGAAYWSIVAWIPSTLVFAIIINAMTMCSDHEKSNDASPGSDNNSIPVAEATQVFVDVPQVVASAPPLNGSWREAFSKEQNRPYYINNQTGVTQWEKPPGYA